MAPFGTETAAVAVAAAAEPNATGSPKAAAIAIPTPAAATPGTVNAATAATMECSGYRRQHCQGSTVHSNYSCCFPTASSAYSEFAVFATAVFADSLRTGSRAKSVLDQAR